MNAAFFLVSSGVLLGALIIAALLLRPGANLRANRMLAASLGMTMLYLVSVDSFDWIGYTALALLLGPPLMYAYVKLLIEPEFSFSWHQAIHLLPFAAIAMLSVVGSAEGVSLTSDNLERARGGWPPDPVSLLGIVMYLVHIGYLARARVLTGRHRAIAANDYSYEEQVTLRWLHTLVSLYLWLSIIALAIALVRFIPGIELWPRTLTSSFVIIFMYYFIAFLAISQPALPGDLRAVGAGEAASEEPPEPRYQTSALTSEDMADYWDRLQLAMGEKQPYLDSKLRIADLADMIDIPTHHLSQIINQQADQNFFEYINGFRVSSAKELLEKSDRSMTAIAFDAGFNSQSAFYRHFKRITGLTPRQFQIEAQREPNNAT